MKKSGGLYIFGCILLGYCSFASADGGAFTDVSENHVNFEAIEYVKEENIVQGYKNGFFVPDNTINRAEFTKIIVESLFEDSTIDNCVYEENFTDIDLDEWYTPYICVAEKEDLIQGYPDKSFRPEKSIAFVEAAKIVVLGFEYNTSPHEIWYKPYVEKLDEVAAIPLTIHSFEERITRGEMAEMVFRLREGIDYKKSKEYEDFLEEPLLTDFSISRVDTQQVRDTWLEWMNTERSKLGLHNYSYDDRLNNTAIAWSKFMLDTNNFSHKRIGQTAYYDYQKILSWFHNFGLDFKNVNRVTFTENIGWGYYKCSDPIDCTDEFIEDIRPTFDFYMSEKGKNYKPHYNSLVNKYFTVIGLGIVEKNGKYALTVHYATEIVER